MDTGAESPGDCNHILPIPCKNKDVYSELNTLIYEYLEVNGLEQALSTFTKECHAKNLPCPKLPAGSSQVKAAFTHYDGDTLLKSFDEGALEPFLKLWTQFQTHIQVTSEDMKKLEVYLRVHFAIYPKAKNMSETKQTQAMQQLKTFFEENSVTLSSDATILPLFALPFVADPRPHPIFKDLFHENWTTKLRTQLESTVNKYFELLQENITNHCKLAKVVEKGNRAQAKVTTATVALQMPSPTSASGNKAAGRRPSVVSRSNTVTVSQTTGPPQAPTAVVTPTAAPVPQTVIPESLLKMTESAILYHQERFLQLLTIHRKTRRVLKGVRENYAKLLKVSSVLISGLERSLATPATIIGSSSSPSHRHSSSVPSLDMIINQCVHIYPEMFIPGDPASPVSSKPDIAHFKQLAATSSSTTSCISLATQAALPCNNSPESSDVSLLFLGIPDISLETVDYSKIKDDLISDQLSATDRLCLLQALRWLITKTTPELRVQVIESYTQNDLLSIQPPPGKPAEFVAPHSQKLFASLHSPTPTYQKESLARLTNAFACTCSGRQYLASTNFIIDTLIRSLTTFKTQEESFICHMVIATLQKLSLRRNMRRYMIDHQVIPWLVKYIKIELDRDLIRSEVSQIIHPTAKKDSSNNNVPADSPDNQGEVTFNTYLMEYAWALLMNLALHPEAIKSSLTVDFEFLQCILTMLTCRNSFDYTPYVLSTLFSLLRNPDFFDKAKSMDLKKKLNPVMSYQPPDIQRHLKHLLTQLYDKEHVDRLQASGETDYDDTDNPDPEDVEPELELPESWIGNQQNGGDLLLGDELLIREYLMTKDIPALTPSVEHVPKEETEPKNVLSQDGDHSNTLKKSVTVTKDPAPPQQNSMSSQHDSVESSFSYKSSRENSSETPPSNVLDRSNTSGIILRPITPTHSKISKMFSSLERDSDGRIMGSTHTSIKDKESSLAFPLTFATPTFRPRRETESPPSPPCPTSCPSENAHYQNPKNNPFLEQFNSVRVDQICDLICHHSYSSTQEVTADVDKPILKKTTTAAVQVQYEYKEEDDEDDDEDAEEDEMSPEATNLTVQRNPFSATPYETESGPTGEFGLHESPTVCFKEPCTNDLVENTTNVKNNNNTSLRTTTNLK